MRRGWKEVREIILKSLGKLLSCWDCTHCCQKLESGGFPIIRRGSTGSDNAATNRD
jgi:hypothetical protein